MSRKKPGKAGAYTAPDAKQGWDLRYGAFTASQALRAAREIHAGREVDGEITRALLTEGTAIRDRAGRLALTVEGVAFLMTSAMSPEAGTMEMAAKLRSDVVEKLVDAGRLHAGHAQAASEIEEVHYGWTRSTVKVASFEPRIASSPQSGTDGDQISRLTRREARLWSSFYAPWSREIGGMMYAGYTHLELVLIMLIDNYGPRQIEEMLRLRHGSAFPMLRHALTRYCDVANIR